MIRVGDTATHDFVVDLDAMQWFQAMSADTSRIHCDPGFAQERGFRVSSPMAGSCSRICLMCSA